MSRIHHTTSVEARFSVLRGRWILSVVVIAMLLSFTANADTGTDRAGLAAEFRGAYRTAAKPAGRVHSIDLVAAESGWGLVPPFRSGAWAYNGRIPGPVIRVPLGDTLEIRLLNQLPQPTSIHWHGIRLENTMDGVPGVTQPEIPPGGEFVYRFTPPDAGTFWFHPHVRSAEQIERGLHGVLVVEDPAGPVYSRELVWVLDDWLIEPGGQIVESFVTRHDLAHDGRWGNWLTVNGANSPSFTVTPGERLRIRMVNVANGRVFAPRFSLSGARVIAVDGMLTAGDVELGDLLLAPGNRVDVDLVVPAAKAGHSIELNDEFTGKSSLLARLEVKTGPQVETPAFEVPRAEHMPAWGQVSTVPVFHEFVLDAARGGHYGIVWTIDGQAWPEHRNVTLGAGRFYKLRFSNRSSRLHPMHLHGQFFRVVARDGVAVNEPYWRDTVLVGPKESVDIGMVPLNTGKWATHCHILEHAEAGMMSLLSVE